MFPNGTSGRIAKAGFRGGHGARDIEPSPLVHAGTRALIFSHLPRHE